MGARVTTGQQVYLSDDTHELDGARTLPISLTWQAQSGANPVIDCGTLQKLLMGGGTFNGLTITSSTSDREEVDDTDSSVGAWTFHTGVVSLTNVRLHALYSGAWWENSYGTWKGVLSQDHGWDSSVNPAGHSLYTQGKTTTGLKTITACIFVKSMNFNLHIYGSSAAFLQGYRFSKTIFLHGRNLIGGQTGVDDIELDDCAFLAGGVELGYSDEQNESLSLTNSLLTSYIQIDKYWTELLTVTGNIVYGAAGSVIVVDGGLTFGACDIDNNVYISSSATPFAINGVGYKSLADWRTYSGMDATSRLYATPALAAAGEGWTLPMVKLYAVPDGGAHIANVAIWNPAEDASVNVDFSSLSLANGDYQLRQVRDYVNDRRAFTYDGSPVAVTMSGTTAYPPGYPTTYHPTAIPDNALPEYGVFELWSV